MDRYLLVLGPLQALLTDGWARRPPVSAYYDTSMCVKQTKINMCIYIYIYLFTYAYIKNGCGQAV